MTADNAILAAVIGLVGTILGYAISIWRSRMVPWVTASRIEETGRASDAMIVDEDVTKMTSQSWFMKQVGNKSAKFSEVHASLKSAENWLKLNESSEANLRKGIEALQDATDEEAIMSAIEMLLGPRGLSDMLELAICRLLIRPKYDDQLPLILPWRENANHRIEFDFPAFVLAFSEELDKKQYKRLRLTPFLEAVSRLDRKNLLPVFTELLPLLQEQNRIHSALRDKLRDLVQDQYRWSLRTRVSNLGSGPFALYPRGSYLVIKDRQIKTIRIECRLLVKDSDGDWTESEDVLIVEPGKTLELVVVTVEPQGTILHAKILRGLYKGGSAKVTACLKGFTKDIPIKRSVRSSAISFAENQ